VDVWIQRTWCPHIGGSIAFNRDRKFYCISILVFAWTHRIEVVLHLGTNESRKAA